MQMQAEYWNGKAGERWVTSQREIDRSMQAITDHWMDWVAAEKTERVLDVGCGTGTTSLYLQNVAKSVTGVDISAPMLALARQRAPDLEFIEADAATADLGTFDLVASRFGVMFFDDPKAAFSNLRRTQGRLAFVCWQPFVDNDWANLPYLAARSLLVDDQLPESRAPGPFAFAERSYVEDILSFAGYTDIQFEARDSVMMLGETVDEAITSAFSFGPLSRSLAALTDEAKSEVRKRLRDVFATTTSPRAAVWLVKAR